MNQHLRTRSAGADPRAVSTGAWYLSLGVAWVSLCLAVGLHVTDEAVNDFLSVYNPAVLRIREQVSFFPMPTFSFEPWVAGLALAVLLGLALSPFVFQRAEPMRVVVIAASALMILNGIGHVAWSIGAGTIVPGTYSSPILLVAAIWTLTCALRTWGGSAASHRDVPA